MESQPPGSSSGSQEARRPSRRVICIVGAPRSGTHLVNSVLATAPAVPPMLSESAPLLYLVRGHRQMLAHAAYYRGVHFDDPQEVRPITAAAANALVEHLCRRFDRDVCVFRSPELSTVFGETRDVLGSTGLDVRYVVMVRDPRDVVASIRRWTRKRAGLGLGRITPMDSEPIREGTEGVQDMARWYFNSYRNIFGQDMNTTADDMACVRYEDLARYPEATAARLEAFCGVEIGQPLSERGWTQARIDFAGGDERVASALTEHYGRPPTPVMVGRWREELDDGETDQVLSICRSMMDRFYPEARAQAAS